MLASQFHRTARRFWRDGALFVVRDVWQRAPERPGGVRLMRCEYAVRNPNGSKRWERCVEGVEFAAILPLRHRRVSSPSLQDSEV